VASEEAPTELRIDGDMPIGLTQQEVIMLEQLKLNVESNVPKRSNWSKLAGSVLGDSASGQGEQLDMRSLPDLASGVAGDSLATQMASELLIDGDLPIGLTPDEARELEQLTQLSELRIDGDLPIGLTPDEARELEQLKARALPASASPPPRTRGSSGANQLAIKGDQGRSHLWNRGTRHVPTGFRRRPERESPRAGCSSPAIKGDQGRSREIKGDPERESPRAGCSSPAEPS
jgi:hypothetical protein